MGPKVNMPDTIRLKPLDEIFKLQKVLIDHYIGIEGLPFYPIDLETKKSQVLIKDFIGRIIEELAEAYDRYSSLLKLKSENLNDIEGTNFNSLNLLHGFNEEISDALHFFIEALIYAGITPEDVLSYYRKNPSYDSRSELHTTCTDGLVLGMILNKLDLNYNFPEIVRAWSSAFSCLTSLEYQTITEMGYAWFYMGGSRVSPSLWTNQAILMWGVTYTLKLASNHLKNRPWYRHTKESDVDAFKGDLLKAFDMFILVLVAFGFNYDSVYVIYYHKNQINQQRIKQQNEQEPTL